MCSPYVLVIASRCCVYVVITSNYFLQTPQLQQQNCTTPHNKQTMVITFDAVDRLNRNLVCIYIILYIYRLFNKNLNYSDTLSFYQSSEHYIYSEYYRCNANSNKLPATIIDDYSEQYHSAIRTSNVQ